VSHDPSEKKSNMISNMIQETFIISINVENSYVKMFVHDSLMNRKFKRTAFI